MKENSNSPAFPEPFLSHPNLALDLKPGLTKREYFAGLAMSGLLTGYSYAGMTEHFNPEKINAIAIKFADELLNRLES